MSLFAAGCVRTAPTPSPSPTPGWTAEAAAVTLRTALRAQGYSDETADWPLGILPPRESPDADDDLGSGDAIVDAEWPTGAWLVATRAGRWWVWEGGDVAPADRTARGFAAIVFPLTDRRSLEEEFRADARRAQGALPTPTPAPTPGPTPSADDQ